MNRFYQHTLLLTIGAAWLAAAGYEGIVTTRHLRRWNASVEQTTVAAHQLERQARIVIDQIQESQSQSREMTFLEGLVHVLPQEKGFARTQKAISDEVDILRSKVGRRIHNQLQILVDTRANKLYVKRGLTLLWSADCSVGKGGYLRDKATGRRWQFVTPRGQFEVQDKYADPVWHKPDWAFVEDHQPIPPPDDPKRNAQGELGAFVFNLGDGYLIHGTLNENLLGRAVSHGCVRLGAGDLKKLYDLIPIGTRVYIY